MNVSKRELFIIFCIAFGMMFLSILPSILFTIRLPKDRQYIPTHNSLSDYPYYTSIIAQGVDGQITVVNRFTNELHEGGYIHVFYLGLGLIGRILHITDAHVLYHGARIILGFVWMFAIYRFIKKFIPSPLGRIAGFFFAVCGAGFPIPVEVRGIWQMTWPLSWWTEFNPILRAAFLPHYLAGHTLLVFGLLSFMGFVKKGTISLLVTGTLAGIMSAIIHPPSYFMIGLLALFSGIVSKRLRRTLCIAIGVALGCFPLLYYRNLYTVFPWTLASSYERLSFNIPFISYVLGLGPILFLGFTGFFLRLRKTETWMFIVWVIVPAILVQATWYLLRTPVGSFISLSNLRFLQVAIWLPLAVGAGIAVEKVISYKPRVIGVVGCLILVLITLLGYPMSLQTEHNRVYGAYDFQFPKKGYIDAMRYVKSITSVDDVVLALPLAGQMIPSYANRTVYVGNKEFYTKDLSRKMDSAWAFYVGIAVCDAYAFVKDNRITTVFYGFDERKAGDAVLTYPFLINAGTFGETDVFRVTGIGTESCGR